MLTLKNIKNVNPNAQTLRVSVKTEEGLGSWIEFLKQSINK